MCGIDSEEKVAAINETLPDYAGFVFCPDDPQYVTPERALELRGSIDEDITIVGVFSNAPVRFVAALMNEDLIEIAQLCGDEDDAYIDSLRSALRAPDEKAIIQAAPVKDESSLEAALATSADMVQLEIASPDFDLALLAGVEQPYFLSGVGAESIGAALSQTSAGYVDAGMLVDIAGVRAFTQAVRAWDEEHPRLSFLESLHPEYHEDADEDPHPELN
jgi:phosphoribosylanthranilate isomerase